MLGAALLSAGCVVAPPAQAPQSAAPAAAPVAAAAAPAAAPAAPAVAAAPVAAAPAVPLRVPDDGTVARFAGIATDLPPGTAALLDLVARDKGALWEIKGYSDRQANQPEPAREAALARALSVRKQLVLRGVPPQNLRVKYSTEEAREAVTVLPQAFAAAAAGAAALPAATALQPLAPAAQALPPQKYSAAAAAAKAAPQKSVKDRKEARKDRKPAAATKSKAKAAPARPAAHKLAPHKPAAHPAHKKPAQGAATPGKAS